MPGAGVEKAAVGERPLGAPGPEPVGDVAVVEHVRGLHAGHHAERGEPGRVDVAQQLGVLDAPAGDTGGGEGVEHQLVRPVADRVHGGVDPVRGRATQQRHQLLRRHQQHPARVGGAGEAGVGVVAVGGAGVQRAVGDDLERAHRQQAAGPGHDVAAAQAPRDRPVRPVERLGPHRRHHAQGARACGDPRRPGVELPRGLVVDDPDHAPRGGRPPRLGGAPVEQLARPPPRMSVMIGIQSRSRTSPVGCSAMP